MDLNEELKIYLQTIRFLDETTDDYLYLYDLINDRVFFTKKISEKYAIEYEENGILLEKWKSLVYAKDREILQTEITSIKECKRKNSKFDYRIIDKEGNKVWVNCRGTIHANKQGHPSVVIGSICEMAIGRTVDSLTGLWNYEKFIEDMSTDHQKENGYLMVLGIDDFKNINVKNGRTFGNYLLKRIADILEGHAVYPMRLYRLDGDRFAVMLPDITREEIPVFYEAVRKDLSVYCTVSAGAVECRSSYEHGTDGGSLYQYAENALDRAKREGKDKLVFFSPEDYQDSLEEIRLQDEIRESIKNDYEGFYLCYQPQVDSKEYTLYGAEALLRYHSLSRDVIGPDHFIPYLEQSGLICQVGKWVLREAVVQCMKWRKLIPDFHISVNISYVQLRQQDITEMVLDILKEEGLPGEALTLEITESMQLQDYVYFNKIFYEWKRHGIRISIDDFGTGYSSLSYLKGIDIDETKIDRYFISRIHYNAYNYRLLRNMIELAHSAQIQVCCEGVETEEELIALQGLNPDVLQGFFFAKPYTIKDFERIYIRKECREYQEREKKEKSLRLMEEEQNSERKIQECLSEIPQEKTGDPDKENILSHMRLGLWTLYIDPETKKCEMYVDDVMKQVIGLEEDLSPEACYSHWYNRIKEGYYHYVGLALENIVRSGRIVQLEYTWNHPSRGPVTVRSMGLRSEDKNGLICLEGYHRIISDLERPFFLPGGLNSEMFEYDEKTHTIYFHTERKMLCGDEKKEQRFPECWIEQQIVHPHFVRSFREMFTDVEKRQNSPAQEILLKSKNGSYEWFSLKTKHLGVKKRDAGTLIVLLESADRQRSLELENMRRSDFYEAMLSETVAYAEVDVESGHLTMAGGLWEKYKSEFHKNMGDFSDIFKKYGDSVVAPEDRVQYKKYLNPNFMREMYKKGISTHKYSFRRLVEEKWIWMELVIHVFQNRHTENMYALLYLKNIDAEKKREFAREKAAQRDPLTNVYNRSFFEDAVICYMEQQRMCGGIPEGALLILDLDNFKQVNDRFGHLAGDETLKKLTEILKSAFRSEDIVGRLGGDEFLVFVKGVSDRTVLDSRLELLFEKFAMEQEIPLACSAGISLIKTIDFDYTKEMEKADTALYRSKAKGKNQYSYYE